MAEPWTLWKDIAYAGRVVVPTEDGGAASYTFTPADLRHIAGTGNAKVRDGWQIPLCWEHQDVTPERLRMSRGAKDRDFARGVFGRIERFDLTPDGRLKALVTGDDPRDLDQFRKVRFVSPEIQWDWTDTDGRTWRGPTVTHLAATPRPVQRHQHPVGADPDRPHPRLTAAGNLESLVRMSLGAGPAGPGGVGRRLRLALEHYAVPKGHPMADDLDTTPPEIESAGPAKKSAWARIAEALAKCGVKIGDGANIKNPEHLADLIEVAAMNSEEYDEPDGDEMLPPETEDLDEPPGDLEGPPEGTTTPPPPPFQMSLDAHKGRVVELEREKLIGRAQSLVRRGAAPAVINPFVAQIKKARLSLTGNARLAPHPLVAKLEAFEEMAKAGTWKAPPAAGGKKTRLSQRGAARPADPSPYQEQSPADDDSIVEAFFSNVGK